jgi:hypothetical protein
MLRKKIRKLLPRLAILTGLVIGLALTAPSLQPATVARSEPNFGVAFGWRGYADTDLNFSEFFAADHTVMLRFMPQYPNAFIGPLLAENGSGAYLIGQGDYNNSPAGRKLILMVGGRQAEYPTPELKAGQWQHLAVVRTGQKFQLYLNGQPLCADPAMYPFCDLTLNSSSGLPTGTLRLGKRTTGKLVASREAQFYGLLDDVAVFKRALSQSEIEQVMSVPRLTGNESGLHAGWTFDPPPAGQTPPPALSRPVQVNSPAATVMVSADRNNAADATALPQPFQQTALKLPFPTNQTWYVIQGIDNGVPGASHTGYASFCWDFALVGGETKNQPFYAAAPGVVEGIRQSNANVTDDKGNCTFIPSVNFISVKQAEGEFADYLHLIKGSAVVKESDSVALGRELAKTGDVGAPCGAYHLHFAVTNSGEHVSNRSGFITYPVAFSDYWASDDRGSTWRYVSRGIPKPGQWLRRAVWVDFSHRGTELGTFELPFNTLSEGVNAVIEGGILRIKAGSGNEPLTISKKMRIEAFGGIVTIGR